MQSQAADLARRLAQNAEAVCRHYLSNGRREGRYWLVGDVRNTPGRSLFVRLYGAEAGKGAAGKWTDAATGEHGDLLDLIALNRGLELREACDEARAFLSVPRPEPKADQPRRPAAPTCAMESARRLFASSQPLAGTVAEAYLRKRGITDLQDTASLRFHPNCYYRSDAASPAQTWPALVAAVTDRDGHITGVHRTWLDPSRVDKAPIDSPRRAMGELLGHGVRFGIADDVLAAGEGIETMLSLRMAFPSMPMIAALSAGHLAAILFPLGLRRIYIARDVDPAGYMAAETLIARSVAAGIEAIVLSPQLGDFNDDLQRFGVHTLRAAVRAQLPPGDTVRCTW
jgi:phage/plasmid primase-like uncharacterized protein